MKKYLTTEEAADYIRYKPQTLANWRSSGIGPDWLKAGDKVLYSAEDLDDWVEKGRKKND